MPDSRIYALYDELVAGGADLERHLHLTVSSYEMLGPVALYRTLGLEFLRFYGVLQDRPLPGLRVTADLIQGEAHGSGVLDATAASCVPATPRRWGDQHRPEGEHDGLDQ